MFNCDEIAVVKGKQSAAHQQSIGVRLFLRLITSARFLGWAQQPSRFCEGRNKHQNQALPIAVWPPLKLFNQRLLFIINLRELVVTLFYVLIITISSQKVQKKSQPLPPTRPPTHPRSHPCAIVPLLSAHTCPSNAAPIGTLAASWRSRSCGTPGT
jgi:hypothetical protein